jgi:hypothetical protein
LTAKIKSGTEMVRRPVELLQQLPPPCAEPSHDALPPPPTQMPMGGHGGGWWPWALPSGG